MSELKQAVAHLESFLNAFRAAGRLEDVLRLALSAEQLVAERKNEAAALQKQIDGLKETLHALKAGSEHLSNEVSAARAAMEAQKEQRLVEIEREIAERREKLLRDHADEAARLEAQRDGIAAERDKLYKDARALEAERSRLHGITSELRAKLAGV